MEDPSFFKEFMVDGISLMLELYPNGKHEEDYKQVSLYIALQIAVNWTLTFYMMSTWDAK